MSAEDDKRTALAVDLDGTLLCGDMLKLSLARLLRRNPLYLLLTPFWLLQGKAGFKAQVARRIAVDPAGLRYHSDILDYVREQRALGRTTVLASGSDQRLVQPVADHLGCFDEVLASDGKRNKTGSDKEALLVERFGAGGFDYIGNSRVDIAVWRSADRVLVAAADERFSRAIADLFPVERVFWHGKPGRQG